MSGSSSKSGGIGILGFMFLALFVGKIFDIKPVGDWSWWWVTAPLWGGFLLVFLFIFIVGIIVAIYEK